MSQTTTRSPVRRRGSTLTTTGAALAIIGVLLVLAAFIWQNSMTVSPLDTSPALDWRPWIFGLIGVQMLIVGVVSVALGAELSRTGPQS